MRGLWPSIHATPSHTRPSPPPAAPTKRPPAGLTAMVPPSRPFHRSAQERPGSRAPSAGTPALPSRPLRATRTEEVGSSVLGKQRVLELRSIAPPVRAEPVRACRLDLGDPSNDDGPPSSATPRLLPHPPFSSFVLFWSDTGSRVRRHQLNSDGLRTRCGIRTHARLPSKDLCPSPPGGWE